LEGGWPKDHVIVTEALRYIESLKNQTATKSKKNLLVVTGSIISEVKSQLQIIYDFEKSNLEYFDNIFIKSHPLIPVKEVLKKFKFSEKVKVTNLNLKDLWSISSFVFTSNSTSVGLEAYYLGLPLVISDSCGNFNLNSLFGVRNVHFINSSNEFEDLIKKNNLQKEFIKNDNNFFCLDSEIPRWKNVLNLDLSV
jgi:surface carbohydrate biosynthesis protein (TIGR04326 family)